MKLAFIIHRELQTERIMELLGEAKIDYFTRWEHVKGKGHKTKAHIGFRGFPVNAVTMIAFQEEDRLEAIIEKINAENKKICLPEDKIHLFQVPLERFV